MSKSIVDRELLWLSGIDQAELIRSRQISARELVDATLARIDALDAKVGAFITVNAEEARRDAAHADDHPSDRPLHGVPFCVKDLIGTAGLRTTHGSAVHRQNVPDHDAPVVTRMRAAGAIVIGKANTPEFGLAAETFTMFGPRACNPHDLSRTTGGSSGGTAAAIAAGMSAIGLGSDAGGSIRLPAAWCGVSGLKPTYGRVPCEVSARLADHPSETVGPMARTVDDLALMMDIIAGHHPADPTSSRQPKAHYLDAARSPAAQTTVAWGTDLGMGAVDDDIAAALHAAADALAQSGLSVRESTMRIAGRHPFFVMFDLIAGAVLGRLEDIADAHWDELAPYSREFLDAGRRLGAADYTRAVYEAKQLRAQLDDELEQTDVVMFPTTAVVAWPHEHPPATVAGQSPAEHGGITYGGLPFLALASVSGHPAMSVPCGTTAEGLPLSVQLVARHFDEAALLPVAARLQAAFPFTRPAL
ncbi:MAG TPA: amidase [Acidimicrobiales bacterium]|nr:amidase [Acidimicrobiales bacterium]